MAANFYLVSNGAEGDVLLREVMAELDELRIIERMRLPQMVLPFEKKEKLRNLKRNRRYKIAGVDGRILKIWNEEETRILVIKLPIPCTPIPPSGQVKTISKLTPTTFNGGLRVQESKTVILPSAFVRITSSLSIMNSTQVIQDNTVSSSSSSSTNTSRYVQNTSTTTTEPQNNDSTLQSDKITSTIPFNDAEVIRIINSFFEDSDDENNV